MRMEYVPFQTVLRKKLYEGQKIHARMYNQYSRYGQWEKHTFVFFFLLICMRLGVF